MSEAAELEELGARLKQALAAARSNGWRTADLEWVLRRMHDRRAVDLFMHIDDGPVAWARDKDIPVEVALKAAQILLLSLQFLRPLPAVAERDETVEPTVVAKVRALLAKAESTTFPAEAEVLTAKAYELMDRYSIDGLVGTDGAERSQVVTRRVFVGDPYARARFALLAEVAQACGCQSVWWSGLGLATVFGYAADLDATLLLYESLTVQAASGLQRASGVASNAPGQKAAFRRAYLLGFARGIGARLRAAHDSAVSDAARTHGGSLLPVLAARKAAVDDAVAALGKVGHMKTRVSNAEGWVAGAEAARRASLVHQPRLPARPEALGAGS